jgi:hypothetical protein
MIYTLPIAMSPPARASRMSAAKKITFDSRCRGPSGNTSHPGEPAKRKGGGSRLAAVPCFNRKRTTAMIGSPLQAVLPIGLLCFRGFAVLPLTGFRFCSHNQLRFDLTTIYQLVRVAKYRCVVFPR